METARAYVSELVRRLSEPGLVGQLAPAVEAVVASVKAGGLTYIFGTGHSHLLALELHYRAGGPAFVIPILDESMMLHEGAIASTARERESGAAATAFARYTIKPRDVVIVISNSGVNAAPLEAARIGRELGRAVIAITSLAYSRPPPRAGRALPSTPTSSSTTAPPGDALVALPDTALKVGPVSTTIGAALLHALFAEAAARLAADGPRRSSSAPTCPARPRTTGTGRAVPAAQPASLMDQQRGPDHENHPEELLAASIAFLPLPVFAQTEITLWHMEQPPHRVARIQELIDEFNAANPDIVVKQEPQNWGEIYAKAPAAVAAGNAPDMLFAIPDFTPILKDMGDGPAASRTSWPRLDAKHKFVPGAVAALQL